MEKLYYKRFTKIKMHKVTTKCRVCLSGDRRMFAISNTDIQEIWEKMTNARFNCNDGKPLLACYICCAQLRKSHQMMKRALKAEELLINFIHNDLEQSQTLLSVIDSQTQYLNYNYSFDTLHCLECKQYKDPAKEIKEEIEEDYESLIQDDCEEENKGNNYFDIKVEEENCSDSYHMECPDTVDDETGTHSDEAPLNSTMEHTLDKEVQIVLQRIDEGAPTTNLKADVTQEARIIYKRVKQRKPSHNAKNISLPKKNCEVVNEKNSRNINTTCNRNSVNNLISKSQSLVSKNNDGSDKKQMVNLVENVKEESDVCKQNQWTIAKPGDLFNSLNVRKKENKCDAVHDGKKELKNFSCHICLCKFNRKCHLNRHMFKHTGKRSYICDLCDYICIRKDNLEMHIKHKHIQYKEFSCLICPSKFVCKAQLNVHLRKHTGEKPYICDVCDYKTSYITTLNNHIKSKHTKAKNFVCDICQYKFSRKFALNRHLLTHTGEKPHVCNLCNKRFAIKARLKYHIKLKHTKK